MFPWDFGIINAIKKELLYSIFPSYPPDEAGLGAAPYLIFELKKIQQGSQFKSLAEFTITIVDRTESPGENMNVLRNINNIIREELVLSQGNSAIGSAKIKVESVDSKKNNLIINMVAILNLFAIYEDEDEKNVGEL